MADNQSGSSSSLCATDFYRMCCNPFKHEKHTHFNKDTSEELKLSSLCLKKYMLKVLHF